MKILFVTNLPSPYRVRFFNELGKYCNLTVLYQRSSSAERDPKWIEKAEKHYKSIFMHGISIGVDKAINIEVIRYLKEDFHKIIICGISSPTEILAIEWCKLHRIPYCIESDGGFVKSGEGIREYIKKHLISSASLCFSTGKENDYYYKFYGAKEQNIIRYPFSSVLLKAAKEIEAQFYIVGGEPTKEYIQMRPENVHFIGFKSKTELADYYKAADVLAHPTREDIWGLVINEALSFGVPVVTTDRCIAGLELVKPGKNGYIVPVDSVEELKNAIEKILYKNCAAYCLETARKYTIEEMAKVHYKIFCEK